MRADYRAALQLLLSVVPAVFRVPDFAMKGGTAINLFLRDMPRASVDIDLVFTRLDLTRDEALSAIAQNLQTVATSLKRQGIDARAVGPRTGPESKLRIEADRASVTIEVNTIFRGTVLPTETHELTRTAREQFGMQLTAPLLAPPELYGGKLVALLDRQHPRDLFDAFLLLENEGLTADIVSCFVIYLAGHNRPAHDVLDMNPKDVTDAYANDFVGMTEREVSLDDLLSARSRIATELRKKLTASQRRFLLSVTRGEPDWEASGIQHADRLPALQWKLVNIARLARTNARKHAEIVSALERVL